MWRVCEPKWRRLLPSSLVMKTLNDCCAKITHTIWHDFYARHTLHTIHLWALFWNLLPTRMNCIVFRSRNGLKAQWTHTLSWNWYWYLLRNSSHFLYKCFEFFSGTYCPHAWTSHSILVQECSKSSHTKLKLIRIFSEK